MLQQSPKNPAHQGNMGGACGIINQDVINIDYHTLPVQVPENLIYKGLEDGWSIFQPIASSPPRIRTRLYVLLRSSFVKKRAPWNDSTAVADN